MINELEIEIVGAEADFVAIHGLLVEAFAGMEGRIDPPSSLRDLTPKDLAQKAHEHGCLTARIGGELVGCAFIEDRNPALYIEKLAVRADNQRQGIGRALIEAAVMVGQSLGRKMLRLQTRIELTENHDAFAALGFRRTRKTRHPGFDRPTSVTMEKRL